ncbi:MAG TPA: RNA polymerase sigma factor [Candidatus Limnocylindrales bacterium]|nr:RNA polymerase sigma factor [Candidatus Limnocylindrales bacterium]
MDQPSDGALLAALERGDPSALAGLVERHQGVLLRHARALLGGGGPYEDAVQETFLRLLQRPPKVPPEASGDFERERSHLRSWLHKVTRNCCMDTLRSETRRKGREEAAAAPERASDACTDGALLAEQRDTREAVERGLARLPAEQREVLVLRLLGERSYKEIAEITGKKIGTVGWLVSEGLRALGEHLSPLFDMPHPALARESAARAARGSAREPGGTR